MEEVLSHPIPWDEERDLIFCLFYLKNNVIFIQNIMHKYVQKQVYQ